MRANDFCGLMDLASILAFRFLAASPLPQLEDKKDVWSDRNFDGGALVIKKNCFLKLAPWSN